MRPVKITPALLIALVACTQEGTPPQRRVHRQAMPAPIVTDRTQYQFHEGRYGPETTIVMTFTAPAGKPVYVHHCNGAQSLGLQRRDGNNWVNAWTTETNGCFSAPIVIPAGGRLKATMTVVSRPQFGMGVEPGTYRAIWHNVLTSGGELPVEQRVSAPFVIDAASTTS